ncbi:3644_t:CDS:10, partial [Racocetra fulgida]
MSRLSSGVPSRTTQMTLKEQERNVDIKIQNHDLKTELKEYKKLLLESDKAIQTLQQNGTGCLLQHGMSPAEEVAYHRAINRAEELSQENDRIQRKLAEQQGEIKRLRESIKITRPEINFDDEAPLDLLDSSTEHQQLKELINRDNRLSGDQNTKIAMLKETLRKERDEKHAISIESEGLRQQILDLKNQMVESNVELKRLQEVTMKNSHLLRKGELERDNEIIDDWDVSRKINDAADKARQDEIEKLKAQITNLNKQLASRTNENDDLYSELEMIKGPLSSTSSCGDISSRFLNGEFSEQYEESLGHLRDKVAELTLQLREKSMEVDQLVVELERNTLAHSTSVQDFEDDMDRMECQFQEEIALLRDNDMRYEESKAQIENQQREILELSQSTEKLTSMEQALNDKGMEITELQCQLEIKMKRLESDEKLHESVVSDLKEEVRDKNSTIDELKAQVAYLENNISQEKKTQYRDQIIERNTLLMTTYQYLDDILSDGTNKQLSTLQEQLEEYKVASAHSEELEIKLRTTESRVRELEYREKQAEERLKVEKQGAKEKAESLIENIKDIEAQLQAQNRRNSQLQEMISMQKASMEEQLREQLEEKNKTIENERRRVKNLEDQMINQRKDVLENTALKNITEDMQIALSLDRKPSYQPPAYINPPWKPAGNNLSVAHPKKTT